MILTIAGTLIPALSTAQETEDHQAIRALFQKEQKGWDAGNGTQILSCYAESYIPCSVPRRNGPPDFLQVTINSDWRFENLKKMLLAPDFVGFKEALADTNMKVTHHYEINHIDVDGNVGVAISTIANAWNDTLRNERVNVGWQSMWLLRKIDGQWKYASAVGNISSYRETVPLP